MKIGRKLNILCYINLFYIAIYFRIIRNTADLMDFTPEQLRTKWNNLFKKYKVGYKIVVLYFNEINFEIKFQELINPPTGVQTEDGEDTAGNWEFFELMHSYGSTRHTIHPPLLLHSQHGAYVSNPANSFTGEEAIEESADINEQLDGITNTQASSSSSIFSGLNEDHSVEPGSSRQLARNYRRDATTRAKKRISTEQIFAKYKKECRRQRKETKAFFNFLDGFSAHLGFNIRHPSESESSSDSD